MEPILRTEHLTFTYPGEEHPSLGDLSLEIARGSFVAILGHNGSGKSTITGLLRPQSMPYINADEIQKALCCTNLEAAQKAEELRESYLAAHRDFCFETVLSTDRNLKLLARAKESGYFIRCYYVLTADPEINVARVVSRVSDGGHDVPAEKIRSRYDKALALVKDLIAVCDVFHIYDNSLSAPYRIFKKRKERCWYCTQRRLWHKGDIAALTGIKTVSYTHLTLPTIA